MRFVAHLARWFVTRVIHRMLHGRHVVAGGRWR